MSSLTLDFFVILIAVVVLVLATQPASRDESRTAPVSLRLLLQVRHVNGSVSENATRLWRSARSGLSVAPDPPFPTFSTDNER